MPCGGDGGRRGPQAPGSWALQTQPSPKYPGPEKRPTAARGYRCPALVAVQCEGTTSLPAPLLSGQSPVCRDLERPRGLILGDPATRRCGRHSTCNLLPFVRAALREIVEILSPSYISKLGVAKGRAVSSVPRTFPNHNGLQMGTKRGQTLVHSTSYQYMRVAAVPLARDSTPSYRVSILKPLATSGDSPDC